MRDDGVPSNGADDGAADIQYCEDDEIVVGGGGYCSWPAFIFKSMPFYNGWLLDCTTSSGLGWAAARAYAICLKKQ